MIVELKPNEIYGYIEWIRKIPMSTDSTELLLSHVFAGSLQCLALLDEEKRPLGIGIIQRQGDDGIWLWGVYCPGALKPFVGQFVSECADEGIAYIRGTSNIPEAIWESYGAKKLYTVWQKEID